MKRHGFKSLSVMITCTIIAIVFVTAIGVNIFSIYNTIKNNQESAAAYREQLEQDVMNELKNETQIAISIVDQYHQMQENGLMSENEAKKAAADVIRNLRYNDGDGYFWVDTADGINVVLLGRDTEGQSRWDLTDSHGNKFIQEMISNGLQEGGGYTRLNFAKPNETVELPKINYTAHYKPYDWVLGTGVWIDHIDELEASYTAASQRALVSSITSSVIVVIVLFIIMSVISLVISKRIVDPLKNVTKKIQNIASGDLSIFKDQKRFERKIMVRNDEIGDIANATSELQFNLRSLMQTISDTTSLVADTAAKLTDNTHQSAEASDLVAQSITSVAQSCSDQNNTVSCAGTSTETFVSKMDEFSNKIKDSSDKVSNTNKAANSGKGNIENAVRQMHTIEDSVLNTSKLVESLGLEVSKIGSIVDTISEIASETNLLSLNASIEAARAGETGRGFAVVATEIQKLANQSNESAQEIAQLISDIQRKSADAVTAMKAGLENVQTGTVVVEDSGSIFEEIANMVGTVAEASQEMSDILVQLNQETVNVKDAFNSINDQSTAISEETQNVSAASQQQSATMQEIASACQRLTTSINDLQKEVARFSL